MKIVNTDVRFHVENGVVLWDSEDWEKLRHETEDTIEAFEVLSDLVEMRIKELTQKASNAETETLSKIMSEDNYLNSSVSPSSFVKANITEKVNHYLLNNQEYQVIKGEIQALVTEKRKLIRKIRALTRSYITMHDNFVAKV